MSRLKTRAFFLGAAVGAAILLTLTVPRAAHAVAAALVQVANTAVAPAITQDVSKLATQNVELTCSLACDQVNNDGALASFTVPANQRLVVTTVQLDVTGGGSTGLSQTNQGQVTSNRIEWLLFAAGTYEYQYPSGIVFASGTTNIAISGTVVANAYLFGYLTSN